MAIAGEWPYSGHMTRSRLVALAAALSVLSISPSAVPASPGTAAAACGWQGFKITNLRATSCATAKKALKHYYGGGGTSQGYKCKSTAASGYRAGSCKKSASASFRFAPR